METKKSIIRSFIGVIVGVATFFLVSGGVAEAAKITAPPSVNSGLVGWWTFDGADTINGVLLDRSGGGNNLSASNIASSTFYGAGKIGQAGFFDGSDDVFSKSNPTGLPTGQSARTISAWIKPTDTGCNPGGGIVHYGNAATAGQEFIFQCAQAGPIYLFTDGVNVGNNLTISGSQLPATDQWNHVAFSFNGASAWVYYLNGQAVSSGSFATTINTATPTILNIGDRTDVVGPNRPGGMDDVRIYNRALSAIEVTQLYRYGSAKIAESKSPGSLSSGLVSHWTFDGADVATGKMVDRSGNGNTGTFSGIASSTFYAEGKIGQGGNFDGTNDYVLTTNNINLNTNSSISLWVKPRSVVSSRSLFGRSGAALPIIAFVSSNTVLTVRNDAGTALRNFTIPTIHPNVWYHFILTRNAAGDIRVYVDGVESSTGAVNDAGTITFNLIGSPASGASNWLGDMDDIRFYNRVLSAQEITRLYNLGQPTKIAATTQNKSTLSTGLVSHWTFDGKDTWGGVLRDRIGDHNAQLNNIASSTFYGAGVIGQAGYFDGSNDFATTSAHSVLNGASTLTVAGWANMRTAGSRGTIFGRWTSATNWIQAFQFWLSNQVIVTMGNGGTTYGLFTNGSAGVPARTQWNHYAMVFDGTQTGNANRLKAYVNGEQVALSFTGTIPATAPTMTNNDYIGYDRHNSLSLDGAADDVRVYSRALSQEEVKALYRMGR